MARPAQAMLHRLLNKLAFRQGVDPRTLSDVEFGAWAEKRSGRYLKRKKFRILARNFRIPAGEIDIVATDREGLVFVEVKAQRGDVGHPERKVTREKRRRLISAAKAYIGRHALHDLSARFDVVTVQLADDGRVVIDHEEDAFQAGRSVS